MATEYELMDYFAKRGVPVVALANKGNISIEVISNNEIDIHRAVAIFSQVKEGRRILIYGVVKEQVEKKPWWKFWSK